MRAFGEKWLLPAGVAAMVVAFACGSSSLDGIKTPAGPIRWLVLVAVLLAACAVSFERYRSGERPSVGLLRVAALPAAFLGLALLSTTWSVTPELTAKRAVSLGLLFALAAALAYATQGDADARRGLFAGLAGGAVTIALLGIVVLAVSYDSAVQAGTSQTPWRFRGFTENPNTISVLAAVAVPIAAWLAIGGRSSRERGLWLAASVLLIASMIAAESRGGILAGDLGLAAVVLAAVRPRRSAAALLAAIAIVTVGGIGLREAVNPPIPPFVSAVAPAPAPNPVPGGPSTTPPIDTKELPRATDEIGNPLLTKKNTSTAGSGRISAWEGALRTAGERPALGYGFGTEQKVFIDRWYYFNGGSAENSFLGILLQLGLVGIALISVFGIALLYRASRLVATVREAGESAIAAGLGVLVSAVGVMVIQSYLYSVGNVATATVWISIFLLGAAVFEPRAAREGRPS